MLVSVNATSSLKQCCVWQFKKCCLNSLPFHKQSRKMLLHWYVLKEQLLRWLSRSARKLVFLFRLAMILVLLCQSLPSVFFDSAAMITSIAKILRILELYGAPLICRFLLLL